jgi:hypothetical protein
MSENQEEVLDNQEETQEQAAPETSVAEENGPTPVTQDEEGTIKINLAELNKPQEDAVQEQSADDSNDVVGESEDSPSSEEVVEEVREPEQNETPVLEEVTGEEVEEAAEELEEQVEQALVEAEAGIELPENIQKVVEFMNETGGTLQDYVKLNTDYSQLNEAQLIKEYYETTKPHLDSEDINVLMEEFSYDEELDDERAIKKAKIAFKEEAAKAKKHLDGLKSKYYEEIKAGSRLNPDQQKAVEFFDRYNKEQEAAQKVENQQAKTFLQKTDNVFSTDFKGFDYSVGDKKYRFKVKDANKVKETQSNINNFVKKFLNDKNEMVDAKGYHKSLFTAMNADTIANHFYEQGKADAMKDSVARSKNVDMDPRGTHEKVTTQNGWTIRAVPGDNVRGSKLRIKKK